MSNDPYRFSWSRPNISNDCDVLYTINGTSCGQCETMTSDTTVTCSNDISEVGDMCTIAVGAIVCEKLSRFSRLTIDPPTPTMTGKYTVHTVYTFIYVKFVGKAYTLAIK